MLDQLSQKLNRFSIRLFGHFGPLGWSFKRSQYKKVWNFVARTEGKAKTSIAGTEDESSFCSTAILTRNMLQRCVGVFEADVILEIGAGVGRVGDILAPICREWIGTDVSENMVAHMKRRLAKHENIRALATSGYDLKAIPSNSIDLVYCTVVFMHLSQGERFSYTEEAFRVLRPGGRFLVDNVSLMSEDGWKMFEEHRAIAPAKRPPNISELSTPQELETYFTRAGFQNIKCEPGPLWIIAYGWKPAEGGATSP